MRKITAYLTVIAFFGILAGCALLGIALPDAQSSLAENRTLTARPVNDLSDLEALTENWNNYAVDQFPMRERLLGVYSALELIQGKRFARNTYVTSDGWLLTFPYTLTDSSLQDLASALEGAAGRTGVPFVYALLPQKNDMLAGLAEPYLDAANTSSNRTRLLDAIASANGVTAADVSGDFLELYGENEAERMYYRTDFHWNALGAFRAAESVAEELAHEGIISNADIPREDDFEWRDLTSKAEYMGDLNRRFSNLLSTREFIPYYGVKNAERIEYYTSVDDSVKVERSEIVARGLGSTELNYSTLSTDNLGYFRVINPDARSDKRVLILKDSYQNLTTDYFTELFREVNVIDPRAYRDIPLQELVKTRNIDAVIFMFHQENVSSELIGFLNG